jgi:hypothetical protein
MKATYIRTEYVTMCASEANDELVNMVAEELSERIQREELIRELGIDLASIFDSTLDW